MDDTDKRFPAIREIFCSFSPPRPFSKTTLGLSFSLVFSSVFHFNIVFFINPFRDIILVSFFWLYLCCPFPFFVPASFLPTSFLPSPSPIHLAFIFGRFALLFFLSSRNFCVRLGASFFPFVLVFVWFASDCCCHHFSSLGFLFLVSLSVVFGGATLVKVGFVSLY